MTRLTDEEIDLELKSDSLTMKKRMALELKQARLLAEKIKWHEDNLGGTPTYILELANKVLGQE